MIGAGPHNDEGAEHVEEISDDAKRLLQEIATAPDHAEAKRLIKKLDFASLPEREREQVECLVADAVAELRE